VNLLFPHSASPREKLQSRLFSLAAAFLFLNSVVLMFSTSVRMHTWIADLKWQHWIGFAVWLAGYSLVYRRSNRVLPDHDPYLLPIIGLLTGWGLLEIFRLDPDLGFRQTIWLGICLALVFVVMQFRQLLPILKKYKYIWLVSGLALTILTFFFGTYPGGVGPRLWLGCCGVYVQPSEFLKILLVVYLAAYLADSLAIRFRFIKLIAPTFLLVGMALLILVAQRDLGTASLFILIYTLIVNLATGKRRILMVSFAAMVIALVAGYLVFDVIKLRVDAWINPWLDPSGRSYQIVQSIMAVANGRLFGRGLGLGSPGTVPVAQSDFIFSAISEEFGLAGAIAIVILLCVLVVRGFNIALHAANNFQRFLAAGVTAFLASQSLLILGGTVRLLPLTGVTFPFVSYGGSSLLTAFFSVLLLLMISNQSEDQPAAIGNSRAYLLIGSIYLAAFCLVALAVGWWSVVRSDALLTRSDNPRRVISDRYVMRGEILDRNNNILAESQGVKGDYQRVLLYPALSATVGYSNPNYGQTGIEASMDPYLRGIEGNTPSAYLISRELYGQYPEGLDIRLSLDLTLQTTADKLMQGKTGGLVVMNAANGEVLAMSNAPTFDANQLDAQWSTWMAEESAPLLNRVTLGQYPAGSATGIFILARYLASNNLPEIIPSLSWTLEPGKFSSCAVSPGSNPGWQQLIASGCNGAVLELTKDMIPSDVVTLYSDLGLASQPAIQTESAEPADFKVVNHMSELFLTDAMRVSPLQMAIAAAELTNGGKVVTPTLVLAYQSPDAQWTLIPAQNSSAVVPDLDTVATVNLLQDGESPVWSTTAEVVDNVKTVSWYIAGTPADWQGVPLVIVVALEDATPAQAISIGQALVDDLLME
jgi:cell division protein FtsW (lipid II flippase)/cell division protein FtsI/penicillin-binding protein 2